MATTSPPLQGLTPKPYKVATICYKVGEKTKWQVLICQVEKFLPGLLDNQGDQPRSIARSRNKKPSLREGGRVI